MKGFHTAQAFINYVALLLRLYKIYLLQLAANTVMPTVKTLRGCK